MKVIDVTGISKDSKAVKVPVKLWLDWDKIEDEAKNQIMNLSCLPFAFHHIAIMPDCHSGYGMPIGAVLATDRVIVPNAVGVDIGCGMCAVKTSLKAKDLSEEIIKTIMGKIRETIPVGKEHNKDAQDEKLMPERSCAESKPFDFQCMYPIVYQEYQSALRQLGTLGGGNHFIEIQKDKYDNVWIMIHSGSRNIGYTVAKHYNKVAYELNKEWHSNTYLPKDMEQSLAFLTIDSDEGKAYIREMQYCIDFALANRKLMMNKILNIFAVIFGSEKFPVITSDMSEAMINIAHNYAKMENHFGKNVMIHRKGATLATKNTIGIIPGDQGRKSYIVRGLGNAESFNSCSHGAGRIMSRSKARKVLNLIDEQNKLDAQGIVHGLRSINNLDEASGAYRDITDVMNNQSDLVEIITELQPLAVIKGD
jgi:tRNA-splicing ligase RtcB